jgi:hypothetical protein
MRRWVDRHIVALAVGALVLLDLVAVAVVIELFVSGAWFVGVLGLAGAIGITMLVAAASGER